MMVSETDNGDVETEPSEEQALDVAEATDAGSIRERLPEDIRAALTKKAFSPGSLRRILRDTYYMGPIAVGTGGWRGMFGGEPGTGMRRPDGALYNFPRSWRYAALERALNLGLIVHVGAGFSATERGVAVLKRIDVCPDCGEERVPGIYSTYYVGNPNSEGHLESHSLVTYCPACGTDGYGGANVGASTSRYERDDEYVDRAVNLISEYPEARTYGGEREVRGDAATEVPDVDPEDTEDLLDSVVEQATPPSPRELFTATDEDLYGRPVVTIPGEGSLYRFRGTPESVSVSRVDTEGDIHITREGEDRLKVGMSYAIAKEYGAADMLHGDAEGRKWSGNYWTVDADALGRVVSKMTLGYTERGAKHGGVYFPDSDEEPSGDETYWTVTVTEDAMDAVTVPMVGVDADGDLIQ
jgi:hypothetical protein